jgi:HK97 family phage major capsid protein
MLNTTPVATDDAASPLRAAAAYEFIPSLSNDSPPVAEILPDELITLTYAVASQYRANGSWVMNSTTAAAIRKLKDSNGYYLWQQGLGGQPDRLFGYPVETWEDMADVATNAFPVAFGDFRRGYLLVDRTQLRITVDHNITTPGKVKFFVRRREGGMPLNKDAVKFLRTTIA